MSLTFPDISYEFLLQNVRFLCLYCVFFLLYECYQAALSVLIAQTLPPTHCCTNRLTFRSLVSSSPLFCLQSSNVLIFPWLLAYFFWSSVCLFEPCFPPRPWVFFFLFLHQVIYYVTCLLCKIMYEVRKCLTFPDLIQEVTKSLNH